MMADPDSRPGARYSVLRRRAARSIAILAALLTAGAFWTIAYGWWRAPALAALERSRAESPISLAELPSGFVEILLEVEDPAFYRHHGIDLGTPGAGMTTISQGLVKFLFFSRFRPGLAKLPQSLLAIGLDARLSKAEQLDLFLNRGHLGSSGGRQVRGFGEAAQVYFGKRAAELDRGEWLALVAMCVGPGAYSVATHPGRNRERTARIERLLAGECSPSRWLDVYYEQCAR